MAARTLPESPPLPIAFPDVLLLGLCTGLGLLISPDMGTHHPTREAYSGRTRWQVEAPLRGLPPAAGVAAPRFRSRSCSARAEGRSLARVAGPPQGPLSQLI